MPVDITDHPDAPDLDELGGFLVEPVAPEVIESRRAEGGTLREVNLLEHEEVDAYLELGGSMAPPRESVDVGTALYRLVQLFGTPQFPEYRAGQDIGHRNDTTFKYLLWVGRGAADPGDEPDEEWLMTLFDWHVELGVALAGWGGDAGAGVDFDRDRALASLRLAHNIASEPVECVFADKWY